MSRACRSNCAAMMAFAVAGLVLPLTPAGSRAQAPAVAAPAAMIAEPVAAGAVTIQGLSVQRVEAHIYFRVKLRWPSADVPESFNEFRDAAGPFVHRYPDDWPVDSVALIPESPAVGWVYREGLYRGPRSDGTFIGRVRESGGQRFLLRCPAEKGVWKYLPAEIDFAQAAPGEKLEHDWHEAQAEFFRRFAAPADQSFFTYARQRTLARIGESDGRGSDRWAAMETPPDSRDRLYDITTGALAIQESLQLDRMRNPRTSDAAAERNIPIGNIEGVTVRSHPWTDMIGDRKPRIDAIAECIPQDQYYVRFRTTRALREFLAFAESWGGSVLSQIEVSGHDYGVREKIETQICLKSTWLSELLGPAVIDSLALTGSDPYLREGSDFSIVFRLRSPAVFEAAVKRYLDEARKAHADIQEEKFDYQGVVIESLTTPDAVVRSYRARFADYCVYSNSPAAIRRIIDAKAGRLPAMSASLDFVYMRTIYAEDAANEDGFIFLSDPFVRELVGPRVRIAEKRRLETVTSMEMIKNAALFYLWENPGAAVPSLEDLLGKGYLDAEHVRVEAGDRLTWDPATFAARSERYGRLGRLAPLVELPVDKVSTAEQREYAEFRARYQNYWRRYFDPIGIRVSVGHDVRLSVTILPLIDNSEYDRLVDTVGGKTVPLAPAQRMGKDVVHYVCHLNPDGRMMRDIRGFTAALLPESQRASFDWIGERVELWVEDSDAFLKAMRGPSGADAFKIPAAVGIQVKNPLMLPGFLLAFQAAFKVSSGSLVVFESTEPYRGMIFTAIKPGPDGWLAEDFKDTAIYYGTIRGYFYLSTSLDLLHRIVDGHRDGIAETLPADGSKVQAADAAGGSSDGGVAGSGAQSAQADTDDFPRRAHIGLTITPAHAERSMDAASHFLAGRSWDAEEAHLRNLWLLARTVGVDKVGSPPAERVLGYRIESALGNTYRYDATRDEIIGSQTGSLWSSTLGDTLPADAPIARLLSSLRRLRVALEFTSTGVRTDLAIERAP